MPEVLAGMLQVAVPLEIERLRGTDPEALCEIAASSAVVVSTHGDDLQFGGRHCASAFAALARGIAAAALTAWGGITAFGIHWCADPRCPGRDAPHDQPVHSAIADAAPRDPRRPVTTLTIHGGLL